MKKVKLLILLIILISLTSCWDMREIDELGLVMAVGVDKAANSNNYIVTVQIAQPKSKGISSSSEKASPAGYAVYTAEGKSLFDATRELIHVSSKRIMWAHNNIIVIGESLARDSILPVIDYFTHNSELRMKTSVVVSEGDAKDYVSSKTGMNDISGVSLANIYSHSDLSAQYLETDLLELSHDYYSEYTQPSVTIVSYKNSKIIPTEGRENSVIDTIAFGGVAIFNKDKMVGELSPDEAQGLSWILEQTGNTVVTVVQPNDTKSTSVETEGVKTEVITSVNNGNPSVKIKISGKGRIVEEDGTTEQGMTEFKKTIKSLVDAEIVNHINMSLNKVQKEYKCDVFDWANYFHTQHNDDWEHTLKYNWQKIYPNIPVTVESNINIYSSTLYQIPISKPKKAGE